MMKNLGPGKLEVLALALACAWLGAVRSAWAASGAVRTAPASGNFGAIAPISTDLSGSGLINIDEINSNAEVPTFGILGTVMLAGESRDDAAAQARIVENHLANMDSALERAGEPGFEDRAAAALYGSVAGYRGEARPVPARPTVDMNQRGGGLVAEALSDPEKLARLQQWLAMLDSQSPGIGRLERWKKALEDDARRHALAGKLGKIETAVLEALRTGNSGNIDKLFAERASGDGDATPPASTKAPLPQTGSAKAASIPAGAQLGGAGGDVGAPPSDGDRGGPRGNSGSPGPIRVQPTHEFPHQGGPNNVVMAVFAAAYGNVITAGGDGVQMWTPGNAKEGVKIGGKYAGDGKYGIGGVSRLRLNPDGQSVMVTAGWPGGWGYNLDVHNGLSRDQKAAAQFDHGAIGSPVDISPNGRYVLTQQYYYAVRVAGTDGKVIAEVPVPGRSPISSARFNGNGSMILVTSQDGVARIYDWDPSARDERRRVMLRKELPQTESTLYDGVFSPDGERVLTHGGNSVFLWQRDGMGWTYQAFKPGDFVHSAQYSPDGKRILVSVRHDQYDEHDNVKKSDTEEIWEAGAPPRRVASFSHSTLWIRRPIFSRNGKYVLTGDGNKVVMWDAATGNPLVVFEGAAPESLQFSADGRQVLAGGHDVAYLWDVPAQFVDSGRN